MMNRWMYGISHRALMAAETGTGSAAPEADAPAAEVAPASPAPDTAAVVAPAAPAASEAPASPAAEAAPQSTPSLLEAASGKPKAEAPKADPDKPAPADPAKPDAKADTSAKAEPVKPDDPGKTTDESKSATDPAKEATALAPPALVTIADLKIPEGVKLADEPSKAFLETLNKADASPKDRAQGLLDLHMAEINRVAEDTAKAVAENQRKVWSEYNVTRKSELRSDPELGGNRLDTSLSIAKAVVEEYGGTPEQQAELFRRLGEDTGTGMGNDVHLNRLLHNIGKALNVFEDKIVTANAKPPRMPKGPGNRGWYGPEGNGATP